MGVFDFLRRKSEPDRFAQHVMDRMRQRRWPGSVAYDAAAFSLKLELNGEPSTIFLTNAFRAWKAASGAERERQIDITIGAYFEADHSKSFEDASPHLLPVVRNRAQMHMTTNYNPGMDIALQPFCGTLAVGLAIDTETSIRYVNSEMLAKWSVSYDDALAVALGNLRAASPWRFQRGRDGFWISDFRDHHDLGRLLLPDLFAQLNFSGDPIAIPLQRSALLVADSDAPQVVAAMAAVAEAELSVAERPAALTPLVLRDGAWSALDTDASPVSALRRLPRLQAQWDYEEQKPLIQARLKQDDQDIFVAALTVLNDGDALTSMASWAEDIDTLLPVADHVSFGRQQPDGSWLSKVRTWRDMLATFGPLTPEPGYYPVRYRVAAWPPGAWEALDATSPPPWAQS